MRCLNYILVGQTPVPEPDLEKWARWFESSDRSVFRTSVEGTASMISTVFLGTDHQWGDGPPMLFETMVFGGDEEIDQYCERCSTWLEAEAQHKRIVKMAELLAAKAKGWLEFMERLHR